ncbi:hypothetical protein FQN50_001565 [Emmonsiellopsis sp. PD_5]|nr:hypothetical protein FQN50_001565 [Emmonsiellopsis sp. PD_5]
MGARTCILVYAGQPLDYAKFRHTGLYIEFDDDAKDRGTLFHITGASGFFTFDSSPGYDPSESKSLRNIINVGELPEGVPKAAVEAIIAATRIHNGINDADWNCQNWVGDALQQLVAQNWLTATQRETAVNQMVTACFEAKDE